MFKLKQGDEIIVRYQKEIVEVTVIGFFCYGLATSGSGIIPFNAGRFYGCGYDHEKAYYTLKKSWHYYPAQMCEFIRLKLPIRLGRLIFGF